MKAGDCCITPHREGTIVHFECYRPLRLCPPPSKSVLAYPEVEFWDEAGPNVPEGWSVRVGVTGCHPALDIGYYPLDQINPIPKGDP